MSGHAAPLDYFLHSHGPSSHPAMILGWVFAAICIAVCIIISGMLIYAVARKRQQKDPRDIEGEGSALRWVFTGTAISACILFAMAVYALVVLNASETPPNPPALVITVTGHQWWWEAAYENADPAKAFMTANEIYIPTGVPVLIKLKSADVIHAFWAPQLAGKTQTIPGLVNQQWLQADKPGAYAGACTQYCGLQHAHMAFDIVAQKPEDFAAWQEAQRKMSPINAQTAPGAEIFRQNCASCHTVRGAGFSGAHAPDLTHLQSRRRIAAGLMENTPDNLIDWIRHAQELKPGARMPDFSLPPDQEKSLATYLANLQ